MDLPIRLAEGVHQGLRHGDGHGRIVRVLALAGEQREFLRLVATVKLIGGADHIAQDCSKHFVSSSLLLMV